MNPKKLNKYIGEIIIYKNEIKTYCFIKFYSKFICELIHNFFNEKFILNNFPLKNSENSLININYCYDLTDLKNSLWYSIILRNLPNDLEAHNITQLCKNFYPGILYTLPPKEIYGQKCTIVVLDDCDEAEKLCFNLNNKEINFGFFLKVKILFV